VDSSVLANTLNPIQQIISKRPLKTWIKNNFKDTQKEEQKIPKGEQKIPTGE